MHTHRFTCPFAISFPLTLFIIRKSLRYNLSYFVRLLNKASVDCTIPRSPYTRPRSQHIDTSHSISIVSARKRQRATATYHTTCRVGCGNNPLVTVVAGLSAEIVESVLDVTPGEALKTRVVEDATRNGTNKQVLSSGAIPFKLVRQSGILAMWWGASPVLCKQAINSAVRFTNFVTLQEQTIKMWPVSDNKMLSTLRIGAITGIVTV